MLCLRISLTWLSILQKRFTIVEYGLFAWIQCPIFPFDSPTLFIAEIGKFSPNNCVFTCCVLFVFVSRQNALFPSLSKRVAHYRQPIQWFIYHMLWQLADLDGNYTNTQTAANVTHTFVHAMERKKNGKKSREMQREVHCASDVCCLLWPPSSVSFERVSFRCVLRPFVLFWLSTGQTIATGIDRMWGEMCTIRCEYRRADRNVYRVWMFFMYSVLFGRDKSDWTMFFILFGHMLYTIYLFIYLSISDCIRHVSFTNIQSYIVLYIHFIFR